MSIASEITRISNAVGEITQAVSDMGGDVSSVSGIDDLAIAVASIPAGGGWTGHADAEGLAAIGWTEEDIAYYQENGVDWDEEEDAYHLVPASNIALYGVLTADNISDYAAQIYYLPKIDTSGISTMYLYFNGCTSMIAIPMLDTSNVTNMSNMFYRNYAFTSMPQLDTSNVTDMSYMFRECYTLKSVPLFDTSNVTNMTYMFYYCYAVSEIPAFDLSSATALNAMFRSCFSLKTMPVLDSSNITDMSYMLYYCYSLTHIPELDASNVTSASVPFVYMYSLQNAYIYGLKTSVSFANSLNLTADSMVYIMNNAQTVSYGTLTFGATNLAKLTDAQIAVATAKGWTVA